MEYKNVKIGADPELFLEREGEIISAEKLIGGTKEKPKPISKEGHFIQEDNIMVEFNIPPSDTKEDFVNNLNFVLDYLTTLASIYDSKLAILASATLDKKYLKTKQAKVFGCDPDFNVYTKCSNPLPSALDETLRTCGGHIHIGYDDPTMEKSERIIYAMDMILGLESILLDKDDRRKEMYGKAGAFRFKSYGVEYRSLSNFWLLTDESKGWAFEKTMQAVKLAENELLISLVEKYGEAIQDTINSNDKETASLILKEIEKILEKELILN